MYREEPSEFPAGQPARRWSLEIPRTMIGSTSGRGKSSKACLQTARCNAIQSPGYVYRAVQDGEEFIGLVCCVATEDYENRRIRRHELTRYDKEEDRTRHIDAVGANTGLVFLLYRDPGEIYPYIRSLIDGAEPDGSTTISPGVLHQIYRVTDEATLSHLEELFAAVPATYIADGHHRAKAARTLRNGAGTKDGSPKRRGSSWWFSSLMTASASMATAGSSGTSATTPSRGSSVHS